MSDTPSWFTKERGLLSPLIYLSNNWLSFTGAVLVTTAGVLWLFLLPYTVQKDVDNPYLGILAFMILPAAFFGGLTLIPLGIGIQLRRKRKRGSLPEKLPPIDLHNRELRKLLMFVLVTTCVNLALGAQLTYKAVHFVDGVTFCGRTCHHVMLPEFTAYQNSPHSRVNCVGCHIGPGASWFVKSKLSGVAQVFATAFETYPRPIPAPVENLRPARETCEQCHWPQKYGADRLRVIRKFAPDEGNTESKTVLLMKIGGGGEPGIHGAHVGNGKVIRYAYADHQRQEIRWVEVDDGHSPVRRYATTSGDDEGADPPHVREMDCMDCHNRPTHEFYLPDRAVDRALASGGLPRDLPWIKKYGLELLQESYSSREQAMGAIPRKLAELYRENQPEIFGCSQETIAEAGASLAEIYGRNVFPEMEVTWGTYPNNIGHEEFPGCFRCHDEMHADADGAAISQDCDTCHSLLAMEEETPDILATLGKGD